MQRILLIVQHLRYWVETVDHITTIYKRINYEKHIDIMNEFPEKNNKNA